MTWWWSCQPPLLVKADQMDVVDLNRVLDEHMPKEFLKAALQSIFLAVRQSDEHCRGEFKVATKTNVANYYCRGKVQDLLYDIAERLPGFTASTKNASGWRHTEIAYHPFTITAHAVDYPCAVVDEAQYRKTLAESQTSLFGPDDLLPDAKLYALVTYSPYRGKNKEDTAQYAYLPGSIYLAFPEAAKRGYAHSIDLFEMFPELVDRELPKEWDTEARLVYRWRAKQKAA